ncbi:MAG: bifunctional serine/threonine kinase and phosphatase [Hyphomicrobiales bacterium]|nr:bifunctional serine/threonine kinase and phosphatase [Hyphomicrobiales bacterium]
MSLSRPSWLLDGVYEHVTAKAMIDAIHEHASDLDEAARHIVAEALASGSRDDRTIQILRVDDLPVGAGDEFVAQALKRTLPAIPEPRQTFDGYRIERQLHASSRSHVFLATDMETGALVALKVPSIDLRHQQDYLKRLMMEEWIAGRINNQHVLKPAAPGHARQYLYTVSEWIDGQTLAQWMIDNPKPDLDVVRSLIQQIGVGLRSFHRKEMAHQDLRPANVMIDRTGTVKIIDFGSTRVAGVVEAGPALQDEDILGTTQYAAPEYFLGDEGTARSDIFSLAAIAYHMLTGRLPYDGKISTMRTRSRQNKLNLRSALDDSQHIPPWVDHALRKGLEPDPARRYSEVSEFLEDLHRPDPQFREAGRVSLLERDPNRFWKWLSLLLGLGVVVHWALHLRGLY